MSKTHKIHPIQIAHSEDGKQIALISNGIVYAWNTDAIPSIVSGLRQHALGHAPESANGHVYSKGDRVHLTDEPGAAMVMTVAGKDAIHSIHKGKSYAMPRREARRIADSFEGVYRKLAGATP